MNNKTISILLIVVGVVAIVLSLSADLLGLGGHAGFGWKQVAAVVVGVLSLAAGWWLRRSSPK